MVIRLATLTVIALAMLLSQVRADEKSDRDRRVKVALALAGKAPHKLEVAPHPRPAIGNYTDGYKAATSGSVPLVVFVGCSGHPAPGAIAVKVNEFGDVKSPAVVVGYPVGEKMFIHETMQCPVDAERLANAIKAASKKIASPQNKDVAAPKPLAWDF